MPRIVISYRRADSDAITGRIFDRLIGRFGADSIFRDIDNIPHGIDFREHIDEALRESDILIAVIGPGWIGPAKIGRARINNKADPVRIEVETALKCGTSVIPVLVGHAKMPKANQLPSSLKDFAFRNALTVDAGKDFDHHIGRLIRDIDRILEKRARALAQDAVRPGETDPPPLAAANELPRQHDPPAGMPQPSPRAQVETPGIGLEHKRSEPSGPSGHVPSRARARIAIGLVAAAGIALIAARPSLERWRVGNSSSQIEPSAAPVVPIVTQSAHVGGGIDIDDLGGPYITVKRANIREKPVADGSLVKTLEAGLPVTVTGRVRGTGWYRVAAANNLSGFVSGDAIKDMKTAEEEDWQRVKDAKQSNIVFAFLQRYPSGAYVEKAKTLRDGLLKDEIMLVPVPPPSLQQALVVPPKTGAQPTPGSSAKYPVGVGQSFRDCAECPEMVVIPAGSFTMGANPASPAMTIAFDRPSHEVQLEQPLAVGKFPVTVGEYARFAQESGAGDNAAWRKPTFLYGAAQTDRHPVVNVSWNDAKAYARWLAQRTGQDYRLLTEAEWEYAARGGTTTSYWWGSDIGRGHAACTGCGSPWDDHGTAPVGSFAPNPFRLYDMAGNAAQWVEDCWRDDYVGASKDASEVLRSRDCESRVVRGGSWLGAPWYLRSGARWKAPAGVRNTSTGFRVARTSAD